MRSYLSSIPNGRYAFVDHVEAGDQEDLRIEITLDIDESGVVVDFSGSSPSHLGPMNLSKHTTVTAVLSAFKHLFPEVPINGGCFRPFEFRFPPECFLDTRPTHAVGGYVEGAIRVMESVFGALADVLPDNVTAASFGTGGTLTLAGESETGEFFATVFPMCGGYGGSDESDGLMHGPSAIGLARFPPLEAAEHDYPIRWQEMSIRAGTGGPGRRRGGPGTLMRVTALSPMAASFLGDRSRRGPFGVLGGEHGEPMVIEVASAKGMVGGAGVSRLRAVPLEVGDTVTVGSPGGGGYGDRRERDEDAVADDVADGMLDGGTPDVAGPSAS
jgi:N-methylhydantoinase B